MTTPVIRPLELGDAMPEWTLLDPEGQPVSLARVASRPLLLVCIRYYG